MQLRTAMLYVKDFERMKRFYQEAFGSGPSQMHSSEVWALFATGSAQFALHGIPAERANDIEIEHPPVPRENNSLKLIFDVEDVELERVRLESIGAQDLRRPWQKHGEACDMADPEGNIFQICTCSERKSALRETADAN